MASKWHGFAGPNHAKLMGLAGLLIAAVIGFAGGVVFERGAHRMVGPPPFERAGNRYGHPAYGPDMDGRGMMGRQSRQAGIVGTVSSVSDQSITVNDTRTNTTVTLSITKDTTITKQGATAKTSDIKQGSRVMVRTSTDSANTATAIDIAQ